MKALLVSRNEHKARELRVALPGWEIALFRGPELPEETGATFYENARAKAAFGRVRGDAEDWILGEDSGLEVDGLGGGPGIRSARYAHERATDAENVVKLLAELRDADDRARSARYVCELVCLTPTGDEVRGSGVLTGSIARERAGSGGFGYDPVFVPDGETKTVAELGDAWKAKNSHRARAARAMRDALEASGRAL